MGFVVASKLVLWSPVGAPAGVPGPRRNADECDAGWFAPVATRRRPIFGALRAPSRRLAVFPGGDDPPEPPDGTPTPLAVSYGPGAWVRSRHLGRWGLWSVRTRVSGRLSVRSSSVVRGWKAPTARRKFSRVPQRQARKPGRLDAVECVASQAANCPPPCGRPATGRTQDPPPVPAGSPRWAGGRLPGRGVLSAAR